MRKIAIEATLIYVVEVEDDQTLDEESLAGLLLARQVGPEYHDAIPYDIVDDDIHSDGTHDNRSRSIQERIIERMRYLEQTMAERSVLLNQQQDERFGPHLADPTPTSGFITVDDQVDLNDPEYKE